MSTCKVPLAMQGSGYKLQGLGHFGGVYYSVYNSFPTSKHILLSVYMYVHANVYCYNTMNREEIFWFVLWEERKVRA